MIKKVIILLFCLAIAIVIAIICWQLRPFSSIIKVSDVDKMEISNFIGDISFTTSNKNIIEAIGSRINGLTFKRSKFVYQSVPDIIISVYSEIGNNLCDFHLYKISSTEYYCRYESNGRHSYFYLIDGEDLFNLAKSYMPDRPSN
ncbi:MAG: hypothetical protein FWG87_01500 [Defluviitaleaceae bacterium]|nr:hypothetical protein [Defluviitaleaceae bacterium]